MVCYMQYLYKFKIAKEYEKIINNSIWKPDGPKSAIRMSSPDGRSLWESGKFKHKDG